MHRPYEIMKDVFDDARFGFGQVNVGDVVDAMWGYSELALSFDDIVHLLRGGCLYNENGEYAQVIVLKKAPWDIDKDQERFAMLLDSLNCRKDG